MAYKVLIIFYYKEVVITVKELGEYLKDTRISNGVSIEEAAEDNNLSIVQLENIENGNIRAFKDVYKLKEYIKSYSKYLGLDPSDVSDEFNEFLFEHTSKISLDDILEAKKKMEEKEDNEKRKIKSPYTKEYKRKINYRPLVYGMMIIGLIALIVYFVVTLLTKEEKHREVLWKNYGEEIYEFTY